MSPDILLKLLPAEHLTHFRNGGLLAFEAIPLMPGHKPVSLAFNTKHIYDVSILPAQHYVDETPIFDVPDDMPPDRVLRAILQSLVLLVSTVGPAEIAFSIAEFKSASNN